MDFVWIVLIIMDSSHFRRSIRSKELACWILVYVHQVKESTSFLNSCALISVTFTDITLTFILWIQRDNKQFDGSSSIFVQTFKDSASLRVNLVIANASSNLQFDLWLPAGRGLLRARITEFPYDTPLFIVLVYHPPNKRASSALSLFLFGQLADYAAQPVSSESNRPPTSVTPSIQFGRYSALLPSAHFRVRSVAWSFEQVTRGRFQVLSLIIQSIPPRHILQ
jgi:hypothetical protein